MRELRRRKVCRPLARWLLSGILLFAGSLVGLAGCGPSVTVRHMDPTVPAADVWLDGKNVGRVDFDDSISFGVPVGRHTLKATRALHEENGWSDDGEDWIIVVQDDVIVTLLPTERPDEEAPPAQAPRPGASE